MHDILFQIPLSRKDYTLLIGQNHCLTKHKQGPRSNFEIGGGGGGETIGDSILGGGHKTLFLTNWLLQYTDLWSHYACN